MRVSNFSFRYLCFTFLLLLSVHSFSGNLFPQHQQTEKIKLLRQEAEKIYKKIEIFEVNDRTAVPKVIRGKLAQSIDLNNTGQIIKFLRNSEKVFRINSLTDNFTLKKKFTDNLNLSHVRLQQTYNGIPVYGAELAIHLDRNNTVYQVNGRFTPDLILETKPSITQENALQIALSDVGPAEYRWQNPEQEKMIKEIYKDENSSWAPKPSLVIEPRNRDFDNGEYRLAWQMTISVDGKKSGDYHYFIDALTGEILLKYNEVYNDNIETLPDEDILNGWGQSHYNGIVRFTVAGNITTPQWEMIDNTRNICTYSATNGLYSLLHLPGNIITSSSDNFRDMSAVDAHWGATQVYDFYKDIFQRNSFDGQGGQLRSTVHCIDTDGDKNLAGWSTSYHQMYFGDGDGTLYSSYTALEVIGHEFTHGVITSENILDYYNGNLEAPAIQEAICDIMGTVIEFEKTPEKADWWHDEDCYTPNTPGDALRYMDNPKRGDQPNTYYGDKWNYGNDHRDAGHYNSGILTYAFYLMCVGGSGTNDKQISYNVEPITIQEARAILYRAITVDYLTLNSNFSDLRTAFLSSAADLYGISSKQYKTVSDAFGAVGIGVRFTAENSFNAGNIKINGYETSSGSNFFATAGNTQTLEALPQDYTDSQNNTTYHYAWNTTGSPISRWKIRNPDGRIEFPSSGYERSFNFDPLLADQNSAYIPDMMKSYYITRLDKTEFDGNISNGVITSVVEQNSGTVSAPSQLIVISSGRTYNFAGWEDGCNGTVTPTGDMTVSALYKMPQKSNTQTTFSNSSQRKFIRTSDGYYHLVYESMGKIWYERSSDGGTTWTLQNNGKPLNTDYVFDSNGMPQGTGSFTTAKHPSLDYYGNRILVAWQEQSGSSYVVRLAFLTNGQPAQANSIPFTSYGLYTEDIYPEIAVKDNGFAVIAIKRNDIYFKGLEVHYLTLFPESGMASDLCLGSITGTDQNTGAFSLATDRNYTDKYHIAWVENGTSTSSMQYARFNYIWLQGEDPNDGSYVLNPVKSVNVSNSTSYIRSYSPSMIGVSDGTARLVFKGYRQYYPGSGSYSISSVSPDNLSWIPYLRKYSGEVYSPQISLGSETYFVGWTEPSGGIYKTIATDASTLRDMEAVLNSSGRDIQINNGGTRFQQFSVGFNSESTTLPYIFKPSDAIGTIVANKKVQISSGRAIFLTQGENQLYFTLGNITSEGMMIDFVESEDSVKLDGNLKKTNSFLMTKPFSLKDNSTFSFAAAYGVRDSLAAESSLKEGDFAKFNLDLIDDASGRVLGSYLSERIDKNNIFSLRESAFKVNSDEIGSRLVRLRLSVDENMKSRYTISDMFFGEGLPLSKSLKEKEMGLNGSMEVKEYSLSQNYPNPFNPTTIISYQIPKASKVTLKVYDMLGKEVATLVNGYMEMGKYSAEFNAKDLTSGIYIYEIRANDFVKSGKMMLLK